KKSNLIHRIQLPAKNITNCTFGGVNNADLFITSAKKGMNKTDLKKNKNSGSLFMVKTNTSGFLQKKFILK
ncbi:MAG: SMP-30/gluconolactonase/LRE family protein, partial [Alphaproteobacteria bacterium]|nr:SMP-30/gluconolactonase/LRE family protein [Alphaproteobacteria bacterium]